MRVPLVLLALPLAALSAVTDETDLPGVVSLVVGRDGVERISCCGYADIARRRRMESDTLFWIASNTKAIAAALMLTVVDEGLVSLDDPVDRYLPEFSRLRVEDPSAADGSRPAKSVPTIRQLLSHTSGLKFFPAMPIDRWPVRLLASKAAAVPQPSDPGTAYRYSNWGIDVAMAVVEVVTGEAWDRVLQKRILDPLEMSDTTFFPSESQLSRLAVSYRLEEGKPPVAMTIDQFTCPYASPARYPEAGGGLFSTARDLAKFFRMLARRGVSGKGRRIVSERMIDELAKKQTPACVDNRYSFGLKIEGDSRVGHGGAYHTYGQADLKTGAVRIFMTQACGENERSRQRFAEWQRISAGGGEGVVPTEGQDSTPLETSTVPQVTRVPDLLTSEDGSKVETVAQWESVRRGEILEFFSREVYGKRPVDRPEGLSFSCEEPDRVMMDGRAIRKRIRASWQGPCGEWSFVFTVFVPKAAAESGRKSPAFLLICNRPSNENIDPSREKKSYFWPAEEIIDRGYAALAFYNGDLAPDDKNPVFTNGVYRVYGARGTDTWGALSAWAWGASRVMDWIESEPALDSTHVAVVGHSRGGKAALLAGVTDRRFAMVCSNDSGCSGAKLNHVDLPKSESVKIITERFPHWFSREYDKWAGREWDMPYDQHEWIALMAPRLVAIASATEDDWAGQLGEFFAARLASPAWELYGKRGLVAPKLPPLCGDCPAGGLVYQDGCVSYHVRSGAHTLSTYDWHRYLDFAERHNWRGAH